MFDDLKLYFAFRKARGAIERFMSMQPDGKIVLLNGLKHFLMSMGAVALAACLGALANDNDLLNILVKSGVPGFVAVALVPLIHALIAMIQKKWFKIDQINVTPTTPDK